MKYIDHVHLTWALFYMASMWYHDSPLQFALIVSPFNNFYQLTLEKCSSPSLTSGVVGNCLLLLITMQPCFSSYKLLMISSKSCVFFTGRKRLRGTLIPIWDGNRHYRYGKNLEVLGRSHFSGCGKNQNPPRPETILIDAMQD